MTEYHIVPRASSAYRTLRRFCLRKPRAVTHHVELNASAEFMEQYIMNMNFNVL